MKKFILMSALVMGGLGLKTADAQLGIRINLHLGNPQPVIVNQPVYDDYYYLPEVEAYYSVGEQCYYYQDGDRWISAAYLPGRYHDFNWRSARRYEIRGNRPYMQHNVYRGKFGGYSNRNDYYAKAYPNRDRNYNDRGQYGNRDWNQNRGNDRRDDRNQGGYNQSTPGRNQGGYNQPGQNQGDRNQQNPSRNQGDRDNGQNRGGDNNSQPSNRQGGQDRGNNTGERYTANKMGVVQDRGNFGRPVRN
jgi:hypothetical protein